MYCDRDGIFRWFLGCLYQFCGCLVVDVEANAGIWYDWLLLCLFYCLEFVRRALWGLIFVSISSIPIHYCDIDVSNRTTSAVCEDTIIWFIGGYLVDAGYASVRHWDGVPNTYGDIFAELRLINRNPPCSFLLGTMQMAPLVHGA